MKLASLKSGRDGALVVVSNDLAWYADASHIAPTLQAALDDWDRARPALAAEVAEFDPELLRRLDVPPGMTGIWQVEARDIPDFDAYRRLDLYYVENWRFTLDLVVLVLTAQVVFSRLVGCVVDRLRNILRRCNQDVRRALRPRSR